MEAGMAKWTPGPWELSYDQGSTRDVISTKGSLPICTMRLSWITHEQYAANALLVAAAPELVEALRTARDYVFSELETERQQMKGYERISRIDEIASDLAEIDAALAKAGVL